MPRRSPAIDDPALLATCLAKYDIPCPCCSYNLRGATSQSCPECGAHIELRVAAADAILGPWIVALLTSTLLAGFLGVFVPWATVAAALAGSSPAYLLRFVPLWTFLLLVLVVLYVLLRRRSWFVSRAPKWQWVSALVLGSVNVVIGAVSAFLISHL